MLNLLYLEDAVDSIIKAANGFHSGYNPYHLWKPEYLTVKELVVVMEELVGKKLQAKWGSISYSGHEMFKPWAIPFHQFPAMIADTALAEGLRKAI